MDANTLRIILLVAGILLLVGIYLWDRFKAGKGPNQAMRENRHRSMESSIDESVGPTPWRVEEEEPVDVEQELRHLDEMVRQTQEAVEAKKALAAEQSTAFDTPGKSGEARPDREPEPMVELPTASPPEMETFGPALDEGGETVAEVKEALPTMILQINVAARDEPFKGKDIQRVAEQMELELGEMQIYHRYVINAGRREVLFNLASMVEPGTIPAQGIEDFSTPGLTLFAQLPAAQDGMMVFSDMLFTAERIASELNGELQDETHSVLNRQTIEYIRSQILEFRRQLQIARKRV
ncbi:MAG TPA: cell division protein ZipA [Chromatiales bacterium]|nr:cell division protein ZipA [Chromatiales bacterium]